MTIAKKILLSILLICNFSVFGNNLQNGIDFFNKGNFTEAKKVFLELTKEQNNSKATFFLGKISLSTGNSTEAITYFEKALETEKTNSEYFLWLGKAYFAETNNVGMMSKGSISKKGRDACLEAIKLDPNNIEARFNVAMYYHNAPFFVGGDDDKAWEQQKEILKRDKKMGYQLSIQFYLGDKEYDDAIKGCNKILKLDKNDTDVYYQMGIIYQADEKYEKAYNAFEKALSIDDKAYNSLYQIGRNAVFSKTHLDRGIECLKKYLSQTPTKALPPLDGAHWRLGSIYQIQGKKEMAKKEFKVALQLSPENDTYQDALDDLN